MRNILALFSLLLLPFASYGQHAKSHDHFWHVQAQGNRSGTFIYTLMTSSEPYTDLTGAASVNNGEIWDDPEYFINLPFDFLVNETTSSVLQLFGLGGLLQAETADPDVFAFLMPFETDLIDRGFLDGAESLSPISFKVDGSAGSRIAKLEFKNAGSYAEFAEENNNAMFVNFQVWMYEGSNTIQFRYGTSFINDPILFFQGESGPLVGTLDYNETNDELTNVNLLTGSSANPLLTSAFNFLNGAPANGTVYTLTIGEPITIELIATDITSYCSPNGSITSEVTGGIPPYTYLWSNSETTPGLQDLDEGTYTVTVTDQAGTTATATATILSTVDPMILDISATDETAEDANDGTATVVATGGFAPFTYLWSNGETTSMIENLAPGTYTVTVTDNAGCSEAADIIVNAFGCAELSLEVVIIDPSCFGLCNGIINILEVINGSAPFEYAWSNGDADGTASGLCAGDYGVTVTDNNNCIVTGTWTITGPDALLANATATDETTEGANDGTATASPTGGTPPYTYLWNNDSTTQQITGLVPGAYTVTVTDDNNCEVSQTVTVGSGFCANPQGTATDVSCFGICDGSIDMEPGWAFYGWSNGSSNGDLDSLCPGVYSVTVSDDDGCTGVATFTISESAPLLALVSGTDETKAGNDGTAWVIPAGGTAPYTYEWSNGSTDSLIVGLSPDIYFVTLTDAHGCADTADVEVGEFVCFVLTENEVQHVFCHDSCQGIIFVVPVGGVGPFDYSWNFGDTSNVVFDLCAGLYSVTVTDLGQNGCSESSDILILQPDSFYFTIDTLLHVTDTTEGSISATFFGGTQPYHPFWLGPDGFVSFDEDINGLTPGTYILNLFDNNDCSVVDSVQVLDMTTGIPLLSESDVAIYPNPATTVIHIETKLTGNYSVELYSVLGVKLGSWNNENVIDVQDLSSGLYVVRFENANGYFLKRIFVKSMK